MCIDIYEFLFMSTQVENAKDTDQSFLVISQRFSHFEECCNPSYFPFRSDRGVSKKELINF